MRGRRFLSDEDRRAVAKAKRLASRVSQPSTGGGRSRTDNRDQGSVQRHKDSSGLEGRDQLVIVRAADVNPASVTKGQLHRHPGTLDLAHLSSENRDAATDQREQSPR